jgi:hypothetical protein
MSNPNYDDVQRAHADLLAEGKIAPRDNNAAVERDKGLLTQRAAWYIAQKNPLIGLMEKDSEPGGNHYVAADGMKYSVDWHLRIPDGVGRDIATDDSGGEPASPTHLVLAQPVNGGEHPPNASYIPRWRPATAQNAQVATTPPPEPEPEPDLQEILDAIAASEATVKAHVTAETDRVMQRLADYRQEVIDFAEVAGKVLALLRLLQRP